MAVFHKGEEVTKKAITILDRIGKMIKVAFFIISIIRNIIDKFDGFLVKFGKLIAKAAEAVQKTSTAVGKLPFFQGPWKFVATVLTKLLSGIANALKLAGESLAGLGKSIRGSKLKKLEEISIELRFKIAVLLELNDKVISLIVFLNKICIALKKEQEDFEKQIPGLKPTAMPLLEKVDKILDEISKILDAVDKSIDPLKKQAEEIQKVIDSFSGIEEMLHTLQKPLEYISDLMKKFANGIQALIKFLYLDWLFDSMEEAVKWVMGKLGITAAINWAAEQVKKLPFVKKLLNLKKLVADIVKTATDSAEKLFKDLTRSIKKLSGIEIIIKSLVELFGRLGINKVDLEDFIPDSLSDLYEKTRVLRKRLKSVPRDKISKDPEFKKEIQKAWKELKKGLEDLQKKITTQQMSHFGGNTQYRLNQSLAFVEPTINTVDETLFEADTDVDATFALIEEQLSTSTEIIADFQSEVDMQDKAYYQELATILLDFEMLANTEHVDDKGLATETDISNTREQ